LPGTGIRQIIYSPGVVTLSVSLDELPEFLGLALDVGLDKIVVLLNYQISTDISKLMIKLKYTERASRSSLK